MNKNTQHTYPFTAIVGQDQMKLALILNIINPTLSGVLIRGEKGTAKWKIAPMGMSFNLSCFHLDSKYPTIQFVFGRVDGALIHFLW